MTGVRQLAARAQKVRRDRAALRTLDRIAGDDADVARLGRRIAALRPPDDTLPRAVRRRRDRSVSHAVDLLPRLPPPTRVLLASFAADAQTPVTPDRSAAAVEQLDEACRVVAGHTAGPSANRPKGHR